MAYISGKYTSATEYSITLGGMAIGTVYAILVQDLNSDGSSNGFVCKWKSGATSSTNTVEYTTTSTYSRYDRRIGFFQGSFNTDVGTVVSDANFNKWADGESVIKAWNGGGGGEPTPTYQTNELNLRTGPGISSYKVKYLGSSGSTYNTATVSNDAASTACWTRADTNLEVIEVNYSDLYGSPFYFKEYTDSTFSTPKKTFADNNGKVYSSGTRYVKLFGTQTSYATYAINLRTGTGVTSYQVSYTNSQGNTITATVSNSAASTVCYVKANSNLTITSVNYATNYAAPYTQEEYNSDFSRVIATTSGNTINASGTKYFKIKGTYVEPTYKAYFRCHSTVKNFSVYRNGEYVSMNSSSTWTPVDLTESKKKITIKNISAQDSYGAPYYVGFYASSSATSPGSQLQSSTGEFTFDYSANRQYSEVRATKQKIDISLFTWTGSDSTDSSTIAKGKPVATAITAARWNNLNATIKKLAEALGKTYSYTDISQGSTFTAELFNNAKNGINILTGHGTLPSTVAKNDEVKASYFVGNSSLKSALNAAITQYKNS